MVVLVVFLVKVLIYKRLLCNRKNNRIATEQPKTTEILEINCFMK